MNTTGKYGNPDERKNEFASKEREKQFFKSPEGYFDKLPDRVMQRVTAETQQKARILPLRRKSALFAAAATLFLLISVGSLFLVRNNSGALPAEMEIAEADIIDQLLIYDYSEEVLIGLISSGEELSEEGQAIIPDSSFTDEEILDYLLNNGMSESELYNL